MSVAKRGRGFDARIRDEFTDRRDTKQFDAIEDLGPGPIESVEGWVLFATNVHAETQEEDLYDLFADYGQVSQIDLNLDRRTGFVKGYALVVYETKDQAERAIKELNGKDLFGQKLSVNWAFSRGSLTKKKSLTSATVRNKSAAQE